MMRNSIHDKMYGILRTLKLMFLLVALHSVPAAIENPNRYVSELKR